MLRQLRSHVSCNPRAALRMAVRHENPRRSIGRNHFSPLSCYATESRFPQFLYFIPRMRFLRKSTALNQEPRLGPPPVAMLSPSLSYARLFLSLWKYDPDIAEQTTYHSLQSSIRNKFQMRDLVVEAA